MRDKQTWLRIESNGWQIIVPETDEKPHGIGEGKDLELAWNDCPCNPKINFLDKMIVHNSYVDTRKISEAMNGA